MDSRFLSLTPPHRYSAKNTRNGEQDKIPSSTPQIAQKPPVGISDESERLSHDTFVHRNPALTSDRVMMRLDLFSHNGYQSEYTKTDAAIGLWQHSYSIRADHDKADIGYLETLLRFGNRHYTPPEDELQQFIESLRKSGLDGSVDWNGISREFETFQSITYEELYESLNYLSSRYVAITDKLQRNSSGDELTANTRRLDSLFTNGIANIIKDYSINLRNRLDLSEDDTSQIRKSLSKIIENMVDAYRNGLHSVQGAIAEQHPKDRWLLNHDIYVAAQLRQCSNEILPISHFDTVYTVPDLAAIGMVARLYHRETEGALSGIRDEGKLALNLAMVDMKAERLIQLGYVSSNMTALLRSSRTHSHSVILDAADEQLARMERDRLPGDPVGAFSPIDRSMFGGIYGATMGTFQQNGGDAPKAIRSGAIYGQAITAKAVEENPHVRRWSQALKNYWNDFYIAPPHKDLRPEEEKVQQMLARVGQSRRSNSAYQNYVNDWRGFLLATGRQQSFLTNI